MRLAHIINFLDINNQLFLLRCPPFLWLINVTFWTLFRPRVSNRFMAEGHTRYCEADMRATRGKVAISGISSSLNYCVMFIALPDTIYKRGRGLRVADSHEPSVFKGPKAQSPASHHGDSGSIPGLYTGGLCCAKWRWYLFLIRHSQISLSLSLSLPLHQCSIVMFVSIIFSLEGRAGKILRTLKQSKAATDIKEHWTDCGSLFFKFKGLTFSRRNFFFNFSTPVHKMWIIQEPNTLELWNKLHFEEREKTESVYHV